MRVFFNGNGINIIRIIPEETLQIILYSYFLYDFSQNFFQISMKERFFYGAISGAIS